MEFSWGGFDEYDAAIGRGWRGRRGRVAPRPHLLPPRRRFAAPSVRAKRRDLALAFLRILAPPHPPPYEELEPGLSRHVARQLGARSTVAVLVFELPLAESPAPILKTEPINSRVGPSLTLCRGY